MNVGLALIFCTVLYLFFTNALFRKVALVLVAGVAVIGGAASGWNAYVTKPRQKAEPAQKVAEAEKRINLEEWTLARDTENNQLQDGRWLFLSTDIDHRRYFLDTSTVEPDAVGSGVYIWIRRKPCPSEFSRLLSHCPSYEHEETNRMWLSCTAQEVSHNTTSDHPRGAVSQPNTMDELFLQQLQKSHFCKDAKTKVASNRGVPDSDEPTCVDVSGTYHGEYSTPAGVIGTMSLTVSQRGCGIEFKMTACPRDLDDHGAAKECQAGSFPGIIRGRDVIASVDDPDHKECRVVMEAHVLSDHGELSGRIGRKAPCDEKAAGLFKVSRQ
jgi:hypothetical protein